MKYGTIKAEMVDLTRPKKLPSEDRKMTKKRERNSKILSQGNDRKLENRRSNMEGNVMTAKHRKKSLKTVTCSTPLRINSFRPIVRALWVIKLLIRKGSMKLV